MDEFFSSISSYFRNRVTLGPALGAYGVLWLVWNNDLVLVYFADVSLAQKFEWFDSLRADGLSVAIDFLVPLLGVICFYWLYPYPARWIYEKSQENKKSFREIKLRTEGEMPMNQAEVADMVHQHTQEVTDLKQKIEQLEKERQLLSDKLKRSELVEEPTFSADFARDEYAVSVVAGYQSLRDEQNIELLLLVAEFPGQSMDFYLDQMRKPHKAGGSIKRVVIEKRFADLRSDGLIEKSDVSQAWILTPDGKEIAYKIESAAHE